MTGEEGTQWFTAEIGKTILAIVGIVLLITIFVSVFNVFSTNNEEAQAKATLEKIDNAIKYISEGKGKIVNIVVTGPERWVMQINGKSVCICDDVPCNVEQANEFCKEYERDILVTFGDDYFEETRTLTNSVDELAKGIIEKGEKCDNLLDSGYLGICQVFFNLPFDIDVSFARVESVSPQVEESIKRKLANLIIKRINDEITENELKSQIVSLVEIPNGCYLRIFYTDFFKDEEMSLLAPTKLLYVPEKLDYKNSNIRFEGEFNYEDNMPGFVVERLC
jgi:hypothetical protein